MTIKQKMLIFHLKPALIDLFNNLEATEQAVNTTLTCFHLYKVDHYTTFLLQQHLELFFWRKYWTYIM